MSLQSNYGDQKYEITLVDQRSLDGFSGSGAITSGALVFVYDAGTKTLSTLYANGNRGTLANPITRAQFLADGLIKFWSGSTSHDIFIANDDGSLGHYAAVTPSTHILGLNRDGVDKCMVFPMVFNAGGTEVDTGLDLPVKAQVYDVGVEVITVDATETVDLGLLSSETAGDADGFIAALSVAVAGFVKPYANTTGSNETYVSTAKLGVLLGPSLVGTDVDKDNGIAKGWGHVVDGSNAKSITYTPSTSDTFAGYGYVMFKKLR